VVSQKFGEGEVTEPNFLQTWERIRKRVEGLPIEESDHDGLEQISKLLERVQKGELSARESGVERLVVVNVHIPGVCGVEPPPETPPANPVRGAEAKPAISGTRAK
jgi:hypothetical protein